MGGGIEIIGVVKGILVRIELHALPAVLVGRLYGEVLTSVAYTSRNVLRPPEALEIRILAMQRRVYIMHILFAREGTLEGISGIDIQSRHRDDFEAYTQAVIIELFCLMTIVILEGDEGVIVHLERDRGA